MHHQLPIAWLPCRCINNGVTLQAAIAESLQSTERVTSKASPLARNHAGSGNRWPVWRKNGVEEAGHFYTIRVVKGQRQVVKRRSAEWQVFLPPSLYPAKILDSLPCPFMPLHRASAAVEQETMLMWDASLLLCSLSGLINLSPLWCG